MSQGQIGELTSSARKLSSIYRKNVIRFGYDCVLFPFTNVIVSGSLKYAHENQDFTKNEWDWLGACMPFVMCPWPINICLQCNTSVSCKAIFLYCCKKAFPLVIVIGLRENSPWSGVRVAWYCSITYFKNMIGFSDHNNDRLCELNQIKGVLPFTTWPKRLPYTASLYVRTWIFQ